MLNCISCPDTIHFILSVGNKTNLTGSTLFRSNNNVLMLFPRKMATLQINPPRPRRNSFNENNGGAGGLTVPTQKTRRPSGSGLPSGASKTGAGASKFASVKKNMFAAVAKKVTTNSKFKSSLC